jgi:hypothetical protein
VPAAFDIFTQTLDADGRTWETSRDSRGFGGGLGWRDRAVRLGVTVGWPPG